MEISNKNFSRKEAKAQRRMARKKLFRLAGLGDLASLREFSLGFH